MLVAAGVTPAPPSNAALLFTSGSPTLPLTFPPSCSPFPCLAHAPHKRGPALMSHCIQMSWQPVPAATATHKSQAGPWALFLRCRSCWTQVLWKFPGVGDTGSSSPTSPLQAPVLGKAQGKGLCSTVFPPYFPVDCPFCLLAQICHVRTTAREPKNPFLHGIAHVGSSLPCHWLTSPWAALCQFSASVSAPTKQLLRRTLPKEISASAGVTSDTKRRQWQFRHCSSLGMLSGFLAVTWGWKGLKPQLSEKLGWDKLVQAPSTLDSWGNCQHCCLTLW